MLHVFFSSFLRGKGGKNIYIPLFGGPLSSPLHGGSGIRSTWGGRVAFKPTFHLLSKGNQVKIPELGQGYICGNTTEPRYVGKSLGKSSLFFLTTKTQGG